MAEKVRCDLGYLSKILDILVRINSPAPILSSFRSGWPGLETDGQDGFRAYPGYPSNIPAIRIQINSPALILSSFESG